MAYMGCPAFILDTSAPLPLRLLSVRPLGRLLMTLMKPSRQHVERLAAGVPWVDLSDWPELADLLAVMQEKPAVRTAIRKLVHAMTTIRGARAGINLTEATLAGISILGESACREELPHLQPAIQPPREVDLTLGAFLLPYLSAVSEANVARATESCREGVFNACGIVDPLSDRHDGSRRSCR